MRNFAIGTIAIVLLAAACASPASVDVESSEAAEFPTTTSPVADSPATTSPVTTSPVVVSDAAPSDESVAPSGDQESETTSTEQEPTVTTQPPKETSETAPLVEVAEPHPSGPVAAAIADLATRLSVDQSAITLVSQEEVTWSDGSLGCPQPDMSYIQVLVNGSLIVLEVDGKTYEYHSGVGRDPFYCPNPTAPASGEIIYL